MRVYTYFYLKFFTRHTLETIAYRIMPPQTILPFNNLMRLQIVRVISKNPKNPTDRPKIRDIFPLCDSARPCRAWPSGRWPLLAKANDLDIAPKVAKKARL
jgi:hypothetical protein